MKLNRFILLILCLMIVGLQSRLWIGESSLAHVDGLGAEVDLQSAENNQKRMRNEVLKAEVMDLREGLDAIEEKARSELGLVKDGETFFLLVEE
jgi:cell division protein FtsB